MKTALTDAEYDRLRDILDDFPSDRAMNLEMIDGFFTALICGPSMVPPGEFLPEIWGGESESAFGNAEAMQEFLDLAMAHWNAVAQQLNSGETFFPMFLEEEDGTVLGNDWAMGFLHGTDMRREDWRELADDEEHAGAMIPIFVLAHEHDPDPELRPYKEPMSKERREQVIAGCAVGAALIYRYFEPMRRARVESASAPASCRREEAKIGRTELCPCGSGNKYKRCCGGATVQ